MIKVKIQTKSYNYELKTQNYKIVSHETKSHIMR